MHNHGFTPGTWAKSQKALGTIITDEWPDAFMEQERINHRRWYGGLGIAESIQNEADLRAMAEAKNMVRCIEMLAESKPDVMGTDFAFIAAVYLRATGKILNFTPSNY